MQCGLLFNCKEEQGQEFGIDKEQKKQEIEEEEKDNCRTNN